MGYYTESCTHSALTAVLSIPCSIRLGNIAMVKAPRLVVNTSIDSWGSVWLSRTTKQGSSFVPFRSSRGALGWTRITCLSTRMHYMGTKVHSRWAVQSSLLTFFLSSFHRSNSECFLSSSVSSFHPSGSRFPCFSHVILTQFLCMWTIIVVLPHMVSINSTCQLSMVWVSNTRACVHICLYSVSH